MDGTKLLTLLRKRAQGDYMCNHSNYGVTSD